MKKVISLMILIVFSFVLVGCEKDENTSGDIMIIDRNVSGVCAAVVEKFYSDDKYEYSFPCSRSDYLFVVYSDGTEENIVDALNNKKIKIEDLDNNGIDYYKEEIK